MSYKKLVLLLMLLTASAAHSQILMSILFGDKLNSDGLEFGLEVGLNSSNIAGLEADKRLSALNLGFYFDIRLKNQWYLYTGVLAKSRLGANELSEEDLSFLSITPNVQEGTYSQKINYFLLPAFLKYSFHNRIYLETGPQFGVRNKAWVEFNSETDDGNLRIRDFNKAAINFFDAGWVIGTGYKLRPDSGITIGIKYYSGFTNVYKERAGSRNNSIFLKANIPIGAHKSEKNK